ncbi:MAG: hypothetical protein ACRDYC_09410, partial [Acidimicrobiales bacterium]
WEVIALVRSLDSKGDAAVGEAAAWLSLGQEQVRAALGYYGAFPEEVDARIAANEAAADQAQREWEIQQQLLG